MLKKLLAITMALFAAAAFAAVDVNKASQAELEAIKGIGPGISGKILDERKKGAFKDWPDLIERIKGVGEGNAAKFSNEGLTVNGAGFKGAAVAPAVPAEAKKTKATKAETADKAEKAASPAMAPADAKAEKKAKAAAKAASKG